MALRKEASPGDRVVIDVSPRRAAPSRACVVHGARGAVLSYSGPAYDHYTVRLDSGEEITLSGIHLKREDLGYGRKSHA